MMPCMKNLATSSWGSHVAAGVLVLCAASHAFAAEQLRTVVVGLEGRRNVDEGLALAMSDVVHGETLSDKSRVVFGRTDLQRVLEFESEKQALGCQADSCLAELASAMDADRIITGSIDKVGSSYFVVIAEIDAKKVEPVGRVQRTLPLDEDKLIIGIQEMTRELLRSGAARPKASTPQTTNPPVAAVATVAAPPSEAEAPSSNDAASSDDPPESDGDGVDPVTGSVEVTSTPAGLDLFRDGILVGKTPYTFNDLAPGTLSLALAVDGGAPLAFEATVSAGETTLVDAVQSTTDPSPIDWAAYESDASTNNWISWGLIGGGVACCSIGSIGGLLIEAVAFSQLGSFTGTTFLGCCCGGLVCTGLSVAGLITLFALGPDEPMALDEEVHRVIVRHPGDDAVIVERPAIPTSTTPEVPPAALPESEPVSLLF
jgi:hypothetical protein